MTRKRKALIIDDSATSIIILENMLKAMNLDTVSARDGNDGIRTAIHEKPDLILLDILMPGIDGFETCERLKSSEETAGIPIIFISTKDESLDKIKGLELGAIDYIAKPFDVGELRARIGVVLHLIELQEKRLELANTDELTGIYNRRHFFQVFEREVLRAKISATPLSLMLFDIDHFKNVNDTYGHLAGDMILKQMGQVLNENRYPLDVVARYGGEEFIVLLPHMSKEKAIDTAEKMRRTIDEHLWNIGNQEISISVSIGLVSLETIDTTNLKEIVQRADDSLYTAKENGRNQVVVWDNSKTTAQPQEGYINDQYSELQDKVSLLSQQLKKQAMNTTSAFVEALGVKNPYFAERAQRSKEIALAIAEEMNLSCKLKETLSIAALLHDIGKLGVPDRVLANPEDLEEGDIELLREHSIIGVKILEPVGIFSHELQIIRQHHERFDGNGYPDGLRGKEIVIGARILSVANAFEYLAYGEDGLPLDIDKAISEIQKRSGYDFDPEVVDALVRVKEKQLTACTS